MFGENETFLGIEKNSDFPVGGSFDVLIHNSNCNSDGGCQNEKELDSLGSIA